MPPKYYGVQKGRKTGVYMNWSDAQAATKGYSGAVHKSFPSYSEAASFVKSGTSNSRATYAAPSLVDRKVFRSGPTRVVVNTIHRSSGSNPSTYHGTNNTSGLVHSTDYDGNIRTPAHSSSCSSSGKRDIVYTDGSSLSNGTAGARAGYGVYYGPNDSRNEYGPIKSGPQTNQRAELTAMNKALNNAYNSGRSLEIRTDSEYSKKSLTEWGDRWDNNGYKSATGKPVENQDLIREARQTISDLQRSGHEVEITKVPAHSGNVGNEMADQLANRGAAQHR